MVKKSSVKELVFSLGYANVFSGIVFMLFVGWSISIVHNWKINWSKEYLIANVLNTKVLLMLLMLIISIFIHEYIHLMVFGFFTKGKNNCVKIGFNKDTLNPYCYCKEKIRLWQYCVAIISPLIILGIIPFIIVTCFYKDVVWLFLCCINISGAGADILMFLIAIKYGKFNRWVIDHPEKVGFIVYENSK